MTVRIEDFHRRATDWYGSNVRQIRDGQWGDPTPCSEWDVRALVRHLVYENVWVPPLMAGQTIEEVGDRFEGDILGQDPTRAWEGSAREASRAVNEEGAMDRTVHLSYGPTPAGRYIFEVSTDLLIHGWDLARAIGADEK